jgi:hypothetical protein
LLRLRYSTCGAANWHLRSEVRDQKNTPVEVDSQVRKS